MTYFIRNDLLKAMCDFNVMQKEFYVVLLIINLYR
jgi:hypothetical protein